MTRKSGSFLDAENEPLYAIFRARLLVLSSHSQLVQPIGEDLVIVSSPLTRSAAQPRAGPYRLRHMASHKTSNCCNNMDCGELNDDEWRDTSEGTKVNFWAVLPSVARALYRSELPANQPIHGIAATAAKEDRCAKQPPQQSVFNAPGGPEVAELPLKKDNDHAHLDPDY